MMIDHEYDTLMREEHAVEELRYRVEQLEKPMEPDGFTVPQAVAELHFRVSQLEQVVETLTQRLDLLTLELHHLKAKG